METKINILVKPDSKKGQLVELLADGSAVVYVREVAVDGKANDAVIKLLAKHYVVTKRSVDIVYGSTSKYKLVQITQKAKSAL